MGGRWSSTRGKVLAGIGAGVLARWITPGLVDEVLAGALAAGLSGALRAAGWQVPATTALSRLRRRLGEQPFELLFGRLCGALSPGRCPWSHVCGLLAVAWDGTIVAAPASAENIAASG